MNKDDYTYTVFQKSDAKIQITITAAYLIRIEICNVNIGEIIIKAAKKILILIRCAVL